MKTDTTTPDALASALREIQQIAEQISTLYRPDQIDPAPRLMPDPDAITETMRLRFSGRATSVRDYQTGEPVPMTPDTVTDDMTNVCPVIELPRGVAYFMRPPHLALVRDSYAEIRAYVEVFRNGSRYSGHIVAPLTPEAMPGNGQNPRPYWDHYPRTWNKSALVELPPGARESVAASIGDLVPDLPPEAITAARIHALHKEAAGELYAGLGKAHREISGAIRAAAKHAQTAQQIATANN